MSARRRSYVTSYDCPAKQPMPSTQNPHRPAPPIASSTRGATTRFSFYYRHPARPDHLYSIAIVFDGAAAPDRYRLETIDAQPMHEFPLSSGPLIARDLKIAVQTLALVTHITSADRGRYIAGRRVYTGWCRSLVHGQKGGGGQRPTE